jgi:PPOX class probable F420-dependent enzyme
VSASGASGAPRAPETIPIPASHRDLLTRPICGVLTTMGSDGRPESSLVWVDVDDECARVNTTLERRKGRNLLADPKVSLLVVDPDNTGRFIQVRGDAELVTGGAPEHLDALQPPCLLRLRVSARAAGARDAGHLPDPRPPDHPRRDPRLRGGTGGTRVRRRRRLRWRR